MRQSTQAVLLVHNAYRQRGGEDVSFEADGALLEANGHRVTRLVFDNQDIPVSPTLTESAHLAIATVWSTQAVDRLTDEIRRSRPHIVHFHNTFPLVSPAAYQACRKNGVGVVQTLHNYRLLCPNGLLFRGGKPCEDCLGRLLPLPGVRHACYRGSHWQTAVVASMLTVHGLLRTWKREVDVYIALTEFARRKFVDGGLPEQRIVVRPNFVEPDPGYSEIVRDGFLFVGRLTHEKGVLQVLEAYETSLLGPLRIAGDGPLAAVVATASANSSQIRYLGLLPREEVFGELQRAIAVVFPSQSYESLPVTILEAFASGTPVIASRLGAMSQLIEDGHTGLLFDSRSVADLRAKLEWAASHYEDVRRMGRNARREYIQKYRGAAAYKSLISIYQQGIDSVRGRLPKVENAG